MNPNPTSISLVNPIALACAYLWIGFVCAISFMEAWLKFQAPGIDLALGLGIGQLVFSALNKVEGVLGIIIIISIFYYRNLELNARILFFLIPVIILLLQTTWLLPTLDHRANQIIAGKTPQSDNLHFWYVAYEIIKVTSLTIYSISLNKSRSHGK